MGGAVLMITITDRSRGEEFANWYQKQGIPLVMTTLGNGTATTEILNLLGLEATEKAVLFCVAARSPRLVRRAAKDLWLDVPGRGVLMTVPISIKAPPSYRAKAFVSLLYQIRCFLTTEPFSSLGHRNFPTAHIGVWVTKQRTCSPALLHFS